MFLVKCADSLVSRCDYTCRDFGAVWPGKCRVQALPVGHGQTAENADITVSPAYCHYCVKGNTRRAIDFHEGETIDEEALKALVRAAVTLNKPNGQS